jgi:hypothetical protein
MNGSSLTGTKSSKKGGKSAGGSGVRTKGKRSARNKRKQIKSGEKEWGNKNGGKLPNWLKRSRGLTVKPVK